MRLRVVDDSSRNFFGPFEVRLPGWTEERYFNEAPEDLICELKQGELIVHSPAKPMHQDIVGFLTFLLRGLASDRGLGRVFNGPASLRLQPGLDREPDIFFIAVEHADRVCDDWIEGPADFVVEVVSEDSRRRDLTEKKAEYQQHGIDEYWAVDTKMKEVIVHRRRGKTFDVQRQGSGRLESTTVRGFWIDISWLWQDPLPVETTCLARMLGRKIP